MKLKVGGVYRSRDGERVEIDRWVNRPTYPFRGYNGLVYMNDGTYYKDRGPHPEDLISEWRDDEQARVDSNKDWLSSSPTPEVCEWVGWNGGECPVHPETVVEVCHDAKEIGDAEDFDWDHMKYPIIAYRIITPYVEPKRAREFWIVQACHTDMVYTCEKPARDDALSYGCKVVHVREVLDG